VKDGFFFNRIHLQCTRLTMDEGVVLPIYVLLVATEAQPALGYDALPEADLALHPAVIQAPVMHRLAQL
jgi:hypothetical protein